MNQVTRRPLSDRQQAVLDAIRASVTKRGYPPTLREIGRKVGLHSVSAVAYQLDALERKGYLRRDPAVPRGLVVLDPGLKPCPHCAGSGQFGGAA